VENLPAQAYHSDEAVGSSLIRKLQTSTPMHALEMLGTPMASPAMALGTALHAAILEPENDLAQAVVQPDIDKRTKLGKEEHAAFVAAHEGRCIITPDQAQQLDGMVAACERDWRIKHCLSACKKREVSVFGEIGGFPAKARLDAWNGHGMVCDLKTTRDLAGDFEKSIASFGYGLQAAWYRAVLRSAMSATGRMMPDDFSFVFLVVETTAPFGTAVYRMSDEVMDAYSERLVELQKLWWKCKAENKYPGWPQDDVVDIGLPAWAMKKLQEQL
jgi:exodeoxyribonuclease VIII